MASALSTLMAEELAVSTIARFPQLCDTDSRSTKSLSGGSVVYPQDKMVKDETIIGWFTDAVSNGEVDDASPQDVSLEYMVTALEDAGIITCHKFWYYGE